MSRKKSKSGEDLQTPRDDNNQSTRSSMAHVAGYMSQEVPPELADFVTVLDAEFGNERAEAMKRLYLSEGSLNDAKLWADSEDPLGEASQLMSFIQSRPEMLRHYKMEARCCIAAAGILTAAVAFPKYFNDPDNHGAWKTGVKRESKPMPTPPITWMESYDILENSWDKLDRLQRRQARFSTPDLETLAKAHEMLRASLESNMVLQLFAGLEDFPADKPSSDISPKQMQELLIHLDHGYLANKSYGLLTNQSITKFFDAKDVNRYQIGLETFWESVSTQLTSHNTERSRKLLGTMILLLRKVFLDTGHMENEYKPWKNKGLLHELEWMLDAYMMILSDAKYENIKVNPSYGRHDRPAINHPSVRRAYDYQVERKKPSKPYPEVEHRVQLKSSDRSNKVYHDAITVYQEQDFEFNARGARRLRDKLDAFWELLKNGLPADESTQSSLRDLCLPSVQAELESIVQAPTDPAVPGEERLLSELKTA